MTVRLHAIVQDPESGKTPTHIYVSDRFEPYIAENTTGRYVWLPLTWHNNDPAAAMVGQGPQPQVEWHEEWQL